MLYLIKTFGRGNKTSIKIGFTNDLNTRFETYRIHNPFFEVISTRQGSMMDELILHLYLKSLGYKESFLNEWFIDVPEINYIFHRKINRMRKRIWKYRELLFDISEKDRLKVSLYWELYNKYFNIKLAKEIDKYFIYKRSSENLKKVKEIDLDRLGL